MKAFCTVRAIVTWLGSLTMIVSSLVLARKEAVGPGPAPGAAAPPVVAATPEPEHPIRPDQPAPPPTYPVPVYQPIPPPGGYQNYGIVGLILGSLASLAPFYFNRENRKLEMAFDVKYREMKERVKDLKHENEDMKRILKAKDEALRSVKAGLDSSNLLIRRNEQRIDHAEVKAAEAVGKGEAALELLQKAGWAGPPKAIRTRRPNPTLLVVEDDPAIAAATARVFSARGFAVTAATTVAEATAVLEKQPHWVILDLNLASKGDGLAFLSHIKEIYKDDIHIVVITGESDQEIIKQAQEAKPDAVLIKPVDLDNIFELMSEAYTNEQTH